MLGFIAQIIIFTTHHFTQQIYHLMRKYLFLLLSLLSLDKVMAQCASTSIYPYEWPSHRNWFMAPGNERAGVILDMQTLTTTPAGNPATGDNLGQAVSQYEGSATVSDDSGNLLMYSNGRHLWTGTGNNVIQTYNGLLEGNENGATGINGSASQGIIAFRHPTAPNDIHIFTTDDANSGTTVGLNHFVFDLSGNLTSGPTRLGSFRTTEALAATRHSNGIDFWVTAMDVTGNFHAYLLTCTGIDIPNSNLSQAGGINVTANNNFERGGLAFSYDSRKMAQAHGSGTASQKVSLYDFDNSTGAITNRMDIGDPLNVFGPYDVIFSPNNNRLYVSWQNSNLTYYDLSSGVQATIQASVSNTGISCGVGAAIQMGASGKLYIASGNQGKGPLREIQEDINTATTFSTVSIPAAQVALGLPRMFIPPLDQLEIQDPGQLCSTGAAINLSTTWQCAGGDAEGLPHTYTSTKGAITDANTGAYDPKIVGVGVDTVIFTLTGTCGLADTLIINVINCACNDAQLLSPTISVCPIDSAFDLTAVFNPQLPGTWSVTPPPASSSNPLSGNIFNANGVDVGTYTLSYTLNNPGDPACTPAQRTIEVVNCCPQVAIAPTAEICVGDSTDLSTLVTSGTGTFQITNGPGGTATVDANSGMFRSDANVSGTYTITFTTNILGCTANDAVDVTVNPYPTPIITSDAAAICNGKSANLIASSAIGSSFTYRWDDNSTNSTRTVGAAGTYSVTMSIGSCSADTSITIGSLPSPVATLPVDTVICSLLGETFEAFVVHNAGANAVISWSEASAGNDSSAIISRTPTTLVVNVTDITGCVARDTMQITEYCIPPEIETPNVMTPGGDNPDWTPFGELTPADVAQSHFEVYDRWGLKMYETDEILPKWNGTNDGRICSSGVYFWIWKYTETVSGEEKSLNGFVQLINTK